MRGRIIVLVSLLAGLVFALLFARQVYLGKFIPRTQFAEKKLQILTYSTFVSSSGPGGEIFQRFKREHACDIEVQTVSDAGLLLERLRLSPFDVVIGLDQLMLNKAQVQTHWQALEPFDWSPLTFIYRKDGGIEPPATFDDLLRPNLHGQIAIEDPRTSSPGMDFVAWVHELKGAQSANFFAQLKPNVQAVAPSWTFAYGLFEKREVGFVLSYLTSLAYHWGVQHDRNFQAVAFPQGHPVQTEYAGVPEGCRECQLAQDFMAAMKTPWAQTLIMQKNFMLPVLKEVEQGTIFAELPELKTLSITHSSPEDLNDWDQNFKH